MKDKVIELISFILIVLLFILMFISSIRITDFTFSLRNYSYHLIFIGILGLITYIINKIKNFKFNKYEIIIFILMILSSLSLINAINIEEALWGMVFRNEGLFVILTYYVMCLIGMNIKNKNYIKILISLILIIGLSNLIYGIYQYKVLEDDYIKGFLGNHNFFGTMISICYPLVLGIFIKSKNMFKKTISYVLLLLFTIGVIISNAMSCFLTTILINIFVILDSFIYLFKKEYKNNINHLMLIIFNIISFILIASIIIPSNILIKKDIKEFFFQSNSVIGGKVEDDFGTGRIIIWKRTIEKIKENYLTGIGIDNFKNAFDPPILDPTGLIITKAHNDYLQKMLCEGIFSGSLFIIFLLIIFFKNLLKTKDSYYYGLYLSFISYSIQAFFNISITRVAPIYFVIIGLLISYENKKKIVD